MILAVAAHRPEGLAEVAQRVLETAGPVVAVLREIALGTELSDLPPRAVVEPLGEFVIGQPRQRAQRREIQAALIVAQEGGAPQLRGAVARRVVGPEREAAVAVDAAGQLPGVVVEVACHPIPQRVERGRGLARAGREPAGVGVQAQDAHRVGMAGLGQDGAGAVVAGRHPSRGC